MGEVAVVRAERGETSKQGLEQFHGVSAQSVGSVGLCAHLLEIPPGGRAKAHRHAGHESVIFVLEGSATVWYGEGLFQRFEVGPGDLIYIPGGVPHLPVNTSDTSPARALVARTDPNEQESVVLMPELDELPHLL